MIEFNTTAAPSTTPRPTPAPSGQLWLYRVFMSSTDTEGFYIYAADDAMVAHVVADRAIALGLGSVTPRHERFPMVVDPQEVTNG